MFRWLEKCILIAKNGTLQATGKKGKVFVFVNRMII